MKVHIKTKIITTSILLGVELKLRFERKIYDIRIMAWQEQ